MRSLETCCDARDPVSWTSRRRPNHLARRLRRRRRCLPRRPLRPLSSWKPQQTHRRRSARTGIRAVSPRSRPGFNSLAVASLGIAIVLVSWLTLSALASIISFFGVSLVLGSIALALYVGGSGVLLYAVVREWRSLRELHQVDALRVALAAASVADVGPAREMCKAWLLRLSPHQPAAMTLAAALDEVTDTSQMRAMIGSRLAGSLDTATRRIGIRAASEGSALVALSPHHSWDGVIVGLHGLRVIRQVAEAHALRPGPAVMLALIGRVACAAVETVATDLLSQTAADQLLGSVPVLKHLAAAIPGISVAGLRLYRLAATVARVCSPGVD